jgi:nucleotide-binding universal stress UspA family protein
MRIRKILFPTDFSHCGDAALETATSLARDNKAKLLIVHVQEAPPAYAGGEMYYGIPSPRTADLKEMLVKVKPGDPGVGYDHRLLAGEPAEAILRCAQGEEVDLIVMGTHGRTGFSRFIMGSVAEAVVRAAKCPVLTFKQPACEPVAAR